MIKYLILLQKSTALHREYPHLTFRPQWDLDNEINWLIGQCDVYIKAINNTPILPNYYEELMQIALNKGAQATTAIEGNTLTDEEIERLNAGHKLPPSKEYQEIEVKNILNALNLLINEIVVENKEQLISPDLLKRFHNMIGKELGEHFQAVPGRFRDSDVVVATYRCPDYRDVPELVDQYCEFLRSTFRYEDGNQSFKETIIQAIVAHVYLEWIHPFGDGNGRTGRLVEFYILARGGNPDIASHILSNHYNLTRQEYYRQIDKAYKERNLTSFIRYALTGFRDGLDSTLEKIQTSQLHATWQRFVYDKFDTMDMKQKDVFKRKRCLALEIPIDKPFTVEEIPELTIKLARYYSGISEQTLKRDLKEVVKLGVIKKKGDLYHANIAEINRMIAKRKGFLQMDKDSKPHEN